MKMGYVDCGSSFPEANAGVDVNMKFTDTLCVPREPYRNQCVRLFRNT